MGARGRLGASHLGGRSWGRGSAGLRGAATSAWRWRCPSPRVGPSAAASRAPSGEARGRWLPLPGSQSAGLAGRGRPWWSRAFCQKPFGGSGLQPRAPWGARKPGRAPGAGPGGGRCRGRGLRGFVAVARAGSLRGKLTGKSPSWHRATRRSGPTGDKAQGTSGSSSIPEGAIQLTLSSQGGAPPPHP